MSEPMRWLVALPGMRTKQLPTSVGVSSRGLRWNPSDDQPAYARSPTPLASTLLCTCSKMPSISSDSKDFVAGIELPRRPNITSSPIQRGRNSHVGNTNSKRSVPTPDAKNGQSSLSVTRATGLVAEVPPSDVVISSKESSDRSVLDSITSSSHSWQQGIHRSPSTIHLNAKRNSVHCRTYTSVD